MKLFRDLLKLELKYLLGGVLVWTVLAFCGLLITEVSINLVPEALSIGLIFAGTLWATLGVTMSDDENRFWWKIALNAEIRSEIPHAVTPEQIQKIEKNISNLAKALIQASQTATVGLLGITCGSVALIIITAIKTIHEVK